MKSTIVLAFSALILLATWQGVLGCWQRDSTQTNPDATMEGSATDGSTVRVIGRVLLNPRPASPLPANARLVVKLQDISLADAPSKLLAKKTLNSVTFGADGIPFAIDAKIPTGTPFRPYTVAVSASLGGDGVSYITDTAYFVNLSEGTFEYKDMVITLIKYP